MPSESLFRLRVFRRWGLVLAYAVALSAAGWEPNIKEILLVHFTHTDLGFTEHPVVARELQRRYLDIALDAALATRVNPLGARFCWTVESVLTLDDWWRAAPAARREQFLGRVRAGQIDVTALPFNNTPFLNPDQWDVMVHWLPEPLWNAVRPSAAMQDDVNGFPRAGARRLLDRGVHLLWMGINSDGGGPPLPAPSAFWWKMPDGRRLFVWVGLHYAAGYDFFETRSWRRGPVPHAADTSYRPPRPGEIFAADEASVRGGHARCIDQLRALANRGYRHPLIILPVTNQWRLDNDPPLPALAAFVAEWNKLGLQPSLRLTTVSRALRRMESEVGASIPEYGGEWTDWWANGTASAPRELAASRQTKRNLAAALSPVWGPPGGNVKSAVANLYRSLCVFDEHTWGSSMSAALPDSLDSIGQFNEKAGLAYRAMAESELLLSQRMRTLLARAEEGLYVANAFPESFSGWVRFAAGGLRGDFTSVENAESGAREAIRFEEGMSPWTRPRRPQDMTEANTAAVFADRVPRRVAAVWVDNLAAHTVRRYRLLSAATTAPSNTTGPEMREDAQGWPIAATWNGMTDPLFLPGVGDLLSVGVKGFPPRWRAMDVFKAAGVTEREKMRGELLDELAAAPAGKAHLEDTGHTLIYEQPLAHARVRWAMRRLEIWKSQPRARLTMRLDRLPSDDPEALFIQFPLPTRNVLPRLTNGGSEFVPYRDQLPGTCHDYFAIDGTVKYDTPHGHWLWFSRDAALVTFGDNSVLMKRSAAPSGRGRILAMVFNNFWYTNFPGNSHGALEFRFDLLWRDPHTPSGAAPSPEALVLIAAGRKDEPLYLRWLYRP